MTTMALGRVTQQESAEDVYFGQVVILHARYFIASLQSIFLAGDLWGPMLKDIGILLLIGAVFLGLAMRATRKRL